MTNRLIFIGSVDTKYNFGGETIKNKSFLNELLKKNIPVSVIDIEIYKSKKIMDIFNLIQMLLKALLLREPKKIIVSKHPNGAFLLFKIINILNIHKKELYYFVIGGTMTQKLKEGIYSVRSLNNIKYIFVESKKMVKDLEDLGIKKGIYIPNFKDVIQIQHFKKEINIPIKTVFVSRIMKEKGINIIVEALDILNKKEERVYCDIYGPIKDQEYRKEFIKLIKNKKYIFYKGIIDLTKKESYEIFSKYDLFVFPTFYNGEGFPGVLIDAMIAGLPILASDWRYSAEIINDKIGYLFKTNNINDLLEKLEYIIHNSNELIEKSKNSFYESNKYDSSVVVDKVLNYIFNK